MKTFDEMVEELAAANPNFRELPQLELMKIAYSALIIEWADCNPEAIKALIEGRAFVSPINEHLGSSTETCQVRLDKPAE